MAADDVRAMKIKDEWRDAVENVLVHESLVRPYQDDGKLAYKVLAAVVPLIAEEVIEACCAHASSPVAAFRNLGEFGIAGALEDTAEEIRRAVPDLLGLTPNRGK